MDLKEYVRLLRRRWVLIGAIAWAVVAVAAVLTLRATPQYASQSRIVVSTSTSKAGSAPDSAYQGGLAATQRVQTYASLVSDGELTQRVVGALGLRMTPGELARKLHAEVVPETTVLQVEVVDSSARRAQVINRAVVSQLQGLIGEIETPPGQTAPLLKGTVVAPPSYSSTPVSPRPLRNLLIGLLLGLIAGIGAAVARELFDTSVKAGRDVEDILGASVLGGIAFDPNTAKSPLISALNSHAPRVEAFRVLRTNLQFVDIDAPSKIFVVTSSVPGEGKSTTAVNIALTMAQMMVQSGHRVLLVDGDLRRPQVASMLGLESEVGVTTVLLGRIPLDEAVQHHASGLEVLTSGALPPNPAELLQSRAMGELLVLLREDYDLVIIDSPPLLPVTDAALLAQQTDGAVVVVRHGATSREQLAGAAARLEAVDARVLGAVFNRIRGGRGGYGYGYGYGYGEAPGSPDETETETETRVPGDVTEADADAEVAEESIDAEAEEGSVAAVVSITGGLRSGYRPPIDSPDTTEDIRPSRRAPGPALVRSSELADTGTGDGTRPGRHRG